MLSCYTETYFTKIEKRTFSVLYVTIYLKKWLKQSQDRVTSEHKNKSFGEYFLI